jgi:hypothetical protein
MSEPANPNEHRFQEIESVLAQLINSQKHLSETQDRCTHLLAALEEVSVGTEQRLQRLAFRTDRCIARITETLKGQAEARKLSDARLAALAALVRKNRISGPFPTQ